LIPLLTQDMSEFRFITIFHTEKVEWWGNQKVKTSLTISLAIFIQYIIFIK